MKPVDIPQAVPAFVDRNGILSLEAHLVLVRMAEALIEAQATIADLEARVTALEP